MAAYEDLRGLFGHGELRPTVEVACIVAAEAIRNESPSTDNHANRMIWAKAAFRNPSSIRDQMLMALIAANKDASVETIVGVSDAALQTLVDAAVDVFADGS